MSSAAGRALVIERYRDEPELGVEALFLEFLARSVNPAQTLIEGSSAADLVVSAGLHEVQEGFQSRLDACTWALYEVRRVTRPGRTTERGFTARSLRVVETGTRTAMGDRLAEQEGRRVHGEDGIVRHIVRDRRTDPANVDHLFVAGPAGAQTKQRPGFEQWWQEATAEGLF